MINILEYPIEKKRDEFYDALKGLAVFEYLDRDDVYLTPNMTISHYTHKFIFFHSQIIC